MEETKSEPKATGNESKDETSGLTVADLLGTENFVDYVNSGLEKGKGAIAAKRTLSTHRMFQKCLRNKNFKARMKPERNEILNTIQLIGKYSGCQLNIANYADREKVEILSQINEIFLQRASRVMDTMEGKSRSDVPVLAADTTEVREISESWNKSIDFVSRTKTVDDFSSPKAVALNVAQTIIRPQVLFKEKVDNSNSPWCPKLKEKPNSMKPLAILLERDDDNRECFSQPYEFELDCWEPKDSQLEKVDVPIPKPLVDTDFMFVENEDQLMTMMDELSKHKMLAVDLEHHSFRSFLGFTCLMQISTLQKDYVIDTLKLRENLTILNEIFTKPSVVKVFHGADSDIEWLQKDFSVYVVNMFDTHQASKVLRFPRLTLAFLLKHYCNLDADKVFQLYDWRTRPLSEKALKYAREDTHYLLYIYGQMSNELLELGHGNPHILKSVYTRSTDICKKRFKKPIFDEESHLTLYRRVNKFYDNRQMFAFRELFKWRDAIARSEDESIGYVLPNHMLFQICDHLPREAQGILGCCNPIPPFVRMHLWELHRIVLLARDQPLIKPVPSANENHFKETIVVKTIDVTNEHRNREVMENLPTILGGTLPDLEDPPEMKPSFSFFSDDEQHSIKLYSQLEKRKKVELTPYERYMSTLPYINKLEEEEKERKKREEEEAARIRARELAAAENEDLGGNDELIKFGSQTEDEARGKKRKSLESPQTQPTIKKEKTLVDKPQPSEDEKRTNEKPPPKTCEVKRENPHDTSKSSTENTTTLRQSSGNFQKSYSSPPVAGGFLNRVMRKEAMRGNHNRKRRWEHSRGDSSATRNEAQQNQHSPGSSVDASPPAHVYKNTNYNKFISRGGQQMSRQTPGDGSRNRGGGGKRKFKQGNNSRRPSNGRGKC